jgi:hypothetical protein
MKTRFAQTMRGVQEVRFAPGLPRISDGQLLFKGRSGYRRRRGLRSATHARDIASHLPDLQTLILRMLLCNIKAYVEIRRQFKHLLVRKPSPTGSGT